MNLNDKRARALVTIPPAVAARLAANPVAESDLDTGWTVADTVRLKADRATAALASWDTPDRPVPADFRDASLVGVEKKVVAAVEEWWAGDALTLHLDGPLGSGKTYIAYALGHRAVAAGITAAFATPEEIVNAYKDDPDFARRCERAGLLLLDDLGGAALPEWLAERLRACIDARVHNGLRTVVTSNLDPKSLAAFTAAHPRLMSRLNMRSTRLAVVRADRRSNR